MKGLIVQFLPKRVWVWSILEGLAYLIGAQQKILSFFLNEKIGYNQTRDISIVNHNKTDKPTQEL